LKENEDRISKMGEEDFAAVQAEGTSIFEAIADSMPEGCDSDKVQEQIVRWRKWLDNFAEYSDEAVWLDNFAEYSDEAVLGLGRAYSQHPRFIKIFVEINEDLPAFLTKAIECYCANKK